MKLVSTSVGTSGDKSTGWHSRNLKMHGCMNAQMYGCMDASTREWIAVQMGFGCFSARTDECVQKKQRNTQIIS